MLSKICFAKRQTDRVGSIMVRTARAREDVMPRVRRLHVVLAFQFPGFLNGLEFRQGN